MGIQLPRGKLRNFRKPDRAVRKDNLFKRVGTHVGPLS